MTAPLNAIESPDGLAGQSLCAAPCSAYLLDVCVADSCAEPTGQCANCGFLDTEHASSAFRREPYRPTVYLEIHDKMTGHHLKGLWRPDRVKALANLVLGWVEDANAELRNDYEI